MSIRPRFVLSITTHTSHCPGSSDCPEAAQKIIMADEYGSKKISRADIQVEWVSHAWLRSMAAPRLRTFLDKGPALDLITDETLAAKGDDMAAPTISNVLGEADDAESARQSRHAPHGEAKGKDVWLGVGPGPEVDAKAGLPIEWSVSFPLHSAFVSALHYVARGELATRADEIDGRSGIGRLPPYAAKRQSCH